MAVTQEEFDKWIGHLREPDMKQVKGTLRAEREGGVGYCCLGVWCEKVKGYEHDGGEVFKTQVPDDVAGAEFGWAGEWESTGIAPHWDMPPSKQRELATMNDNGRTFGQIADFLENKGLDWLNSDDDE